MDAHSSYQYQLLKEYYVSLDVDIQENKFLRQCMVDGMLTFSMLKLMFFKKKEREGKLICVYCQEPLKIYIGSKGNLPKDMVTLDHFIPLSQGGLKYVESNFLCTCDGCNNKRDINPSYKVTETKYIW
jgi:5-methylcytosine-specific restriction endonuclease McrA